MPLIPEDTIVAVREATDIVALVSRYVRDLKAAGKNHKGRCPFHDEKTPSFTVSTERQNYRCFGCNEGGNAIHFLMKIEGIPFPDAVRQLAKEANIVIPENAGPQDSKRDELYKVNLWVAGWYQHALQTSVGQKAREYMASRKINEEMAQRFLLGYAEGGWDKLLLASAEKDLPQEHLISLGLIVHKEEKKYDFYRDRLMFPIHDHRERVVGFGGRELDGSKVKYINSSESEIFRKSSNLYGLHQGARSLRRERVAILVEGYTDVIMCHQFGFETAVAALGTALNSDHAKVLKRYVDKVILCLDADEAGKVAAERALSILLSAGLEVKVTNLKGVKDPCDFLLENGAEAFTEVLKSSKDCVDFYFEGLDRSSPDQIHSRVNKVTSLISLMPSPILRELYQDKLAELSNLRKDSINSLINVKNDENEQKTPLSQEHYQTQKLPEAQEVPDEEFGVLAAMIAEPKKAQYIIESLATVELTHPLIIRMISFLFEHITGSPDTKPSLCAAIFQDEREMTLVTRYEEMAKNSHWINFLGCLKRLKQKKIEAYKQLEKEAISSGDKDKSNDYKRKIASLYRDLKMGTRVSTRDR